MAKVVFNACYGGFGLSTEAVLLLAQKKGISLYEKDSHFGFTSFYIDKECKKWFDVDVFNRHDKDLVAVVEELGSKANGMCAKLCIKEVNGQYRVTEYDGYETVETPSGTDWMYAE